MRSPEEKCKILSISSCQLEGGQAPWLIADGRRKARELQSVTP